MNTTYEPTFVTDQPVRASSEFMKGLPSPLTLGLVSCGAVGAFLFTVTYMLEGLTRPGYDVWHQPISALSLGPGGWIQQVNFVVFGVLLILSAIGWRRLLRSGRASVAFPLVQSLIGVCMIMVGFFSQDPAGYPTGAVPGIQTMHGTIHTVAAYIIFFALTAGCFVLAGRFAVEPGWQRWTKYSVVTGILILAFFVQFIALSGIGGPGGAFERVSALAHAVWSILIVVVLLYQKRNLRGSPSSRGK